MKKIFYLLVLAIGVAGCSVESLDSSDELISADAKIKIQEAQNPMGFYSGPNLKGTVEITNDCSKLYITIKPTGDDPDDAKLGVFPGETYPATSGNSENIETSGFNKLDSATNLTWSFPLKDAVSFNIFINAWSDWAGTSTKEGIKQTFITYNVDYSGCVECTNQLTTNLTCSTTKTVDISFKAEEDGPIVIQGGLTSGAQIIRATSNLLTRNTTHSSVTNSKASVTRWEGDVDEACKEVTITIEYSDGNGIGDWTAKRGDVELAFAPAKECE